MLFSGAPNSSVHGFSVARYAAMRKSASKGAVTNQEVGQEGGSRPLPCVSSHT
jgi:hypothetical protein